MVSPAESFAGVEREGDAAEGKAARVTAAREKRSLSLLIARLNDAGRGRQAQPLSLCAPSFAMPGAMLLLNYQRLKRAYNRESLASIRSLGRQSVCRHGAWRGVTVTGAGGRVRRGRARGSWREDEAPRRVPSGRQVGRGRQGRGPSRRGRAGHFGGKPGEERRWKATRARRRLQSRRAVDGGPGVGSRHRGEQNTHRCARACAVPTSPRALSSSRVLGHPTDRRDP